MYILFQYSSKINTNNILVSASRTFQIFLTNIKTDVEDKVGHTDCPHLYILRTPLIFLYFSLSLSLPPSLIFVFSDCSLIRPGSVKEIQAVVNLRPISFRAGRTKVIQLSDYTKTNISGHQKLYKLNTTLYVIDAYKIHFKKQKVQIVV